MNSSTPYEIEHKYLIRTPDLALLEQKPGVTIVKIEQTYLVCGGEGENRRVRAWTSDGKTVWYYTRKKKITSLKRIEEETVITAEEARELLREADPCCRPITKTRYRYPENGFLYEVDIFPFWEKQAFLEVEVAREDIKVPFPEDLVLLREVTDDKKYTNHALAREIPAEEA